MWNSNYVSVWNPHLMAEIKCVGAQPHGKCVPCWYFAVPTQLKNH